MAKKMKLSDNLRMELETMISDSLKPGDKLPTEAEISERYSVGRSTVREALNGLKVKGLIYRTNEGSFVSDKVNQCLMEPLTLLINMQIGSVEDLLQLRQIIELGTIKIAAEKITDETIDELTKINWQMQEPGASEDVLLERDINFHHAIATAAGNAVIVEMLDAMRKVIASQVENPSASKANIKDTCQEHDEIISALSVHDGNKAYELLSNYFRRQAEQGSYTK